MSGTIAELTIKVDARQPGDAAKSLDGLTQSGAKAEAQAGKTAAAHGKLSSELNKMLSDIRQATQGMLSFSVAQDQAAKEAAELARRQAEAAAEARKAAAAQAEIARAAAALRAQIDPLGTAIARVNQEMHEADALYKKGAISAQELAQANAMLAAKLNALENAHAATAGSMKNATQAGIGLSRQFADIGVSAASGISPLLILIQQGPQIADQMAIMKTQGVGMGEAFKAMGASMRGVLAMLAPLLPALIAVGTAAAAAFGAAGLAARALNKENGDLTKGLGLTEKQLERLKEKGVETGVTIGDVFRGTFNYIKDAIAPSLAPIGKFFSDLFDRITKGAVAATKGLVGGFIGAFEAIKATWKMFPNVLGDLVISGVNLAIRAVNDLVQKTLTAINGLIDKANAAARKAGISAQLPTLSAPQVGLVDNPFAGSASKAADAAKAAFKSGRERGDQIVDGVLGGISNAILDAARDRIRKAAGDAGKDRKSRTARDPRDMSDEASAQVAAQLEQAYAEELRARMALVTDVRERAEIEKDLVLAATAAKQAQVDKQIAAIADAKGMPAAVKAALTAQLREVQAINANVAALEMEAIDRKKMQQLARDALQLEQARRQNAIDVREAQAALLQSTYAQSVAQQEILAAKQEVERYALEEVVRQGELAGYSEQEVKIAKDRLAALGQIHSAEMEAAKRATSLSEAMKAATDNVRSFKDAFKRRDWAGLLDSFAATIQTIQASFRTNGLAGGLATTAGVIGSVVGGKAGKAINTGLTYGIGASLGASALGAAGGQLILAGGAGALGTVGMGLASLSATLGALAGPIGIVAGLASLFLGKKPSNHAGITTLTQDSFQFHSSGKETDETKNAVIGASQGILDAMQALESFGVSVNTFVTGLDLGTRDMTHIFLSNGQELRSAVGDPAAAVETAMKAVLQGATYASEAQKKMVESALAAGKGFDAIAQELQKFAAAQAFSQEITDGIVKVLNPKAYDVAQLQRAQAARDKSFEEAVAAGYYEPAQVNSIRQQLDTLKKLELAEVLKKYGAAVEGVTLTVEDATSQLEQAYNAEASALQDMIDKQREYAKSLNDLIDDLTRGPGALLSPEAQFLADQANFRDVASRARLGDPAAQEAFVQAAQDYRQSAEKYFASSGGYFNVRDEILAATRGAQATATRTADNAQGDLDLLKQQISGLITINTSVLSVKDAIDQLRIAQGFAAGAGGGTGGGILSAPDIGTWLAANSDVYQSLNGGWLGDVAKSQGFTQEQALAWWYREFGSKEGRLALPTGFDAMLSPAGVVPSATPTVSPAPAPAMDPAAAVQTGIDPATGLPYGWDWSMINYAGLGFATTGSFRVGGAGGPDSQFVPLNLTPGEIVDVRRPYQATNDNSDVCEEIRALRAEVAGLKLQLARHGEVLVESDARNTGRIVSALDDNKTQRLAAGASLG